MLRVVNFVLKYIGCMHGKLFGTSRCFHLFMDLICQHKLVPSPDFHKSSVPPSRVFRLHLDTWWSATTGPAARSHACTLQRGSQAMGSIIARVYLTCRSNMLFRHSWLTIILKSNLNFGPMIDVMNWDMGFPMRTQSNCVLSKLLKFRR